MQPLSKRKPFTLSYGKHRSIWSIDKTQDARDGPALQHYIDMPVYPRKKETNDFRMEASMVKYYEKKHRQGHGDRLRILCKYIYSCKISAITTLYPFSNTISYIIVFHNLFFLYLAYCNISLLQVERCIDPFFLFNFQNV